MNRPTTESDVAVYGMIRSSSLFLFMTTIILRVCVCVCVCVYVCMCAYARMCVCTYTYKIHCKYIHILNYIITLVESFRLPYSHHYYILPWHT